MPSPQAVSNVNKERTVMYPCQNLLKAAQSWQGEAAIAVAVLNRVIRTAKPISVRAV